MWPRAFGVLLVFALLVAPASLLADANRTCPIVYANPQGAANADVTVDNTAGGVVVLVAAPSRCSALISNGSNPIRCAVSTGAGALAPTTTAGFLLNAGQALGLSIEDGVTQGWKCIRTTAGSSTVSVLEGRYQ